MKKILLLLCAGILVVTGCSFSTASSPEKPQPPEVQQTESNQHAVLPNSLSPEETALRILDLFLKEDFAAARPLLHFSRNNTIDISRKEFSSFSRHLRQRIKLDLNASGNQNNEVTFQVGQPQALSGAVYLTEGTVAWDNGRKKLSVPIKLVNTQSGWSVEYEEFMLSIVEGLETM